MNQVVQHNADAFALDFSGVPDFGDYESDLSQGLQGYAARNEVSLKNSWFMLNKADGTTLNCGNQTFRAIIIASNPKQSKSYFTGTFGSDDSKLACSSTNGIAPNKYVTDQQLADNGCGPTCAKCRWNVKGSSTDGKSKACSDRLHIVVLPEADPATPYAMSLSITALIALKNYVSALNQQAKVHGKKAPLEFILTEMFFEAFDANGKAHPQPRLNFRALGFVPPNVMEQVKVLRTNQEVLRLAYNDEESIAQLRTAEDMMGVSATPAPSVFNAPGAADFAFGGNVQQPPVMQQQAPVVQQAPQAAPPVMQQPAAPAWGQQAPQATPPVMQQQAPVVQQAPQAAPAMSPAEALKAKIAARTQQG